MEKIGRFGRGGGKTDDFGFFITKNILKIELFLISIKT